MPGLSERYPDGQLFAVFEPRSATACRNIHQEAYTQAFDAADVILLAPLGRSNIPESERLDIPRLTQDLKARGKEAMSLESVMQIVDRLAAQAVRGDTVALLSNGSFGGIGPLLAEALEKRAAE